MVFYVAAALTVICAVMVIVSRNPVISALWLVGALVAQAVIFLLLGAHLVAALQILLYAGAIMVLILFVIMMINLGTTAVRWRILTGERLILGAGAFYFLATLSVALYHYFRIGPAVDLSGHPQGTVEATGALLLTRYAVPFELLSILLLAAIVGAVVTSKKRLS